MFIAHVVSVGVAEAVKREMQKHRQESRVRDLEIREKEVAHEKGSDSDTGRAATKSIKSTGKGSSKRLSRGKEKGENSSGFKDRASGSTEYRVLSVSGAATLPSTSSLHSSTDARQHRHPEKTDKCVGPSAVHSTKANQQPSRKQPLASPCELDNNVELRQAVQPRRTQGVEFQLVGSRATGVRWINTSNSLVQINDVDQDMAGGGGVAGLAIMSSSRLRAGLHPDCVTDADSIGRRLKEHGERGAPSFEITNSAQGNRLGALEIGEAGGGGLLTIRHNSGLEKEKRKVSMTTKGGGGGRKDGSRSRDDESTQFRRHFDVSTNTTSFTGGAPKDQERLYDVLRGRGGCDDDVAHGAFPTSSRSLSPSPHFQPVLSSSSSSSSFVSKVTPIPSTSRGSNKLSNNVIGAEDVPCAEGDAWDPNLNPTSQRHLRRSGQSIDNIKSRVSQSQPSIDVLSGINKGVVPGGDHGKDENLVGILGGLIKGQQDLLWAMLNNKAGGSVAGVTEARKHGGSLGLVGDKKVGRARYVGSYIFQLLSMFFVGG